MNTEVREGDSKQRFVADVLTIFPEMFVALTQSGVTRRALEEGRWSLDFCNPRDFSVDNYRTVDDRPYGGGPGMVMRPEPLEAAIVAARARQLMAGVSSSRVVCLSPQGAPLTHRRVMQFVRGAIERREGVVLLCGRYEGIDERLIERYVDEEISIGDYVLSGGEIPAMVLIDSISRLLPGVLGKDESSQIESFSDKSHHIEFPQYTRPAEYEGKKVPEVLLSGDPKKIKEWQEKSLSATPHLPLKKGRKY